MPCLASSSKRTWHSNCCWGVPPTFLHNKHCLQFQCIRQQNEHDILIVAEAFLLRSCIINIVFSFNASGSKFSTLLCLLGFNRKRKYMKCIGATRVTSIQYHGSLSAMFTKCISNLHHRISLNYILQSSHLIFPLTSHKFLIDGFVFQNGVFIFFHRCLLLPLFSMAGGSLLLFLLLNL